jgi:sugar phosphate isomerase/epimerase
VEVLISRFVTDQAMDLSPFAGAAMQVAFFQRKTFNAIDHRLLYGRLRDHGIAVRSVHAPAADVHHRAGDEFMNTLRTIKDVYGVQVITVHPQRGEKESAKAHFRELEAEIRRMGIILAYETFEKEMMDRKWVSQVDEMHEYFDALEYPFLGVTYDFTHSSYEDNVEEVARYHDKIFVVHLSDALRDKPLDPNEYHQHLPLGFGNYRVAEFLDLLVGIDYRHFIVIEYHPEYDALLKTDAAAVAAYLGGNKAPLLDLMEERSRHRPSEDK